MNEEVALLKRECQALHIIPWCYKHKALIETWWIYSRLHQDLTGRSIYAKG